MPTMYPVNSSNLAKVGFENDELFVEFKNGALYSCRGTEEECTRLRAEPTAKAGGFYHENIRSRLKKVS